VDDAAFVEVADGIDDGTDNVSSFFLSVDHLLCYLIVELASREVLKNEVDVLLVREVIVKINDVGVLNVAHDVDLSLE
jgi:hypothetical protein